MVNSKSEAMENLIKRIEHYAEKYEFNFQFWGEGNNNIYIIKDDVALYDSGGHETIKDCLEDTLKYLDRINRK